MKSNKKICLVALVVIFFTCLQNQAFADNCFLFEGTYVGAAILTTPQGKQSRPFFIVVGNKHITGFFAPEDQNHSTGGSSFNLAGFEWTNVYTFSLGNNSISIKYPNDTTLNGKAKLISVDGGSGSFSGFYHNNPNPLGDFLPGDFLNIGPDGGAIVKVAAGKDVVHAFGKIDSSGKFVQVFPEKGKGPKVDISISDNTANLNIRTRRGSFTNTMKRFVVTSCNATTPSSSSGGTIESTEVDALLDIIKDLKGTKEQLEEERKAITRKLAKKVKEVFKKLNTAISGIPDVECQSLFSRALALLNLASAVFENDNNRCNDQVREDCLDPEYADEIFQRVKNSINGIEMAIDKDDDGDGTPNVCEIAGLGGEEE